MDPLDRINDPLFSPNVRCVHKPCICRNFPIDTRRSLITVHGVDVFSRSRDVGRSYIDLEHRKTGPEECDELISMYNNLLRNVIGTRWLSTRIIQQPAHRCTASWSRTRISLSIAKVSLL